MIASDLILGVVLAGGLSRRMEGNEKSLLNVAGKPLITRVCDKLKHQVSDVLVNANGDPARFEFLGLPVQADTVEGFAGPLAGVLAGMAWAKENMPNKTHIITAAADTPFFPDDYFAQMLKQHSEENAEIALAGSHERHHPVFGLWPISLHDALKTFLVDEENRKVMLFVQRYRNCRVDFANKTYDPFFNVNTPQELAQVEELLKDQG